VNNIKDDISICLAQVVDTPSMVEMSHQKIVDFCVADESEWHSIGFKLVQEIKAIAKKKGAAQVLVVCGTHDGPKCRFLKKMGLTVASEWYVGSII